MEQLTLFTEDHHAKTSQWLADVQAWMARGAACSGTSAESLLRSLPLGFCGKTSLALCPLTADATSLPCCGDSQVHDPMCPLAAGETWALWSGHSESPSGGCLTLAGSESHSDADVCSLSAVLEPSQTVSSKYFLSPRAAAGILKRAQRRGRSLPPALHAALTSIAETSSSEA